MTTRILVIVSIALAALLAGIFGCSTTSDYYSNGGRHVASTAAAPASTDLPPLKSSYFSDKKIFVNVSFSQLNKYDTLYAMSDIHGQLDMFIKLLEKASLIKPSGGSFSWTNSKALLVITGDYIDKDGPDGAGTLLTLMALQKAYPSNVIVLMGNHEAEYLADPDNCSPEFFASLAQHKVDGAKSKRDCDIRDSDLGKYMNSLPVSAIVGNWMFVHSGYINVDVKDMNDTGKNGLGAFFEGLSSSDGAGKTLKKKDYNDLANPKVGFVGAHNWAVPSHKDVHALLNSVGISGLLVGHEPGLLDAKGYIAVNSAKNNDAEKGWFTKLDVGMNADSKDSTGVLLQCKIKDIMDPHAKGNSLRMLNDSGTPICSQISVEKGTVPVKLNQWPTK